MSTPPSGSFRWPEFARHLSGSASPEARVQALLDRLAAPEARPDPRQVMAALFGDSELVETLVALRPRLHHIGFLSPRALDAEAIEDLLRRSAFGEKVRRCASTVLAKELTQRFARPVAVTIFQGWARRAAFPAVEIFAADLTAAELDALIAAESGCHVALAFDSRKLLDRAREALHAYGRTEIPLMQGGPLVNDELHASVLYVDVGSRRLELMSSD